MSYMAHNASVLVARLEKMSTEDYIRREREAVKVGDCVLVSRKIPDYYEGWSNTWVPKMDEYIGKVFTVSDVCTGGEGVMLREDLFHFGFPYQSLIKVKRREE